MTKEQLIKTIKQVFDKQNLGVLATFTEEYPYTSLVGFVSDKDCRSVIFATLKNTRKHTNLRKNPKVSMLINSGINNVSDFQDAVSITAFGHACDADKEKEKSITDNYLEKFPFLEDFINNENCVLVKITVKKYLVVSRFQQVQEISMC